MTHLICSVAYTWLVFLVVYCRWYDPSKCAARKNARSTLHATACASAEESVFGALQWERSALLKNRITGNGQSRGATLSLRLANEMRTSGRWQTYSATWRRQHIPRPTHMKASWKLLNLLRHRNENSDFACNGTDKRSCCHHVRCVIVELLCGFQSI